MKRRVFLGLPVILGILFYIWYIFHASDNVAYSDYIRLVNRIAGCDKSGEILCTGYPDARSDHVSGAHHQCETIWL